jgi:hypothetical protein
MYSTLAQEFSPISPGSLTTSVNIIIAYRYKIMGDKFELQ